MNESLKVLIEIQELDTEIQKAKIRRNTLPKEIESLESQITRIKSEKEKIISDLKKEEVKLLELEVDLREIQERIRNYQEKSRQVKNNEEYRAMLSQIEHADTEKRKKEEEIFLQMEMIEKMKEEKPKRIKELEERISELEANLNTLREELQSLQEGLELREKKKTVLVEKLPEREKQMYEKLQSRVGPYVICKVIKTQLPKGEYEYVCTGCYSVLPLSFVQELKLKQDYSKCPNCGRIVYYYEEM